MTPASFCGITHEYPFMTPEPSAFGVFAAGQAPDHLPVAPLQAACQEQVSIATAQSLFLTRGSVQVHHTVETHNHTASLRCAGIVVHVPHLA